MSNKVQDLIKTLLVAINEKIKITLKIFDFENNLKRGREYNHAWY